MARISLEVRPSALLLLLTLLLSSLSRTCLSLASPKFTKIPTDQIGVSGGVVSFVCQATGDPKPQVIWNKKGKKVNSQRIEAKTIEFDEGAGAVLRIQPLRAPRDENVYECVARNTEGEIAVTSKLSIIREDLLPFGFPSIDMGPQLKVVERTRTATMLCAASGIPDPEISWFKDFLPVEPALSQGRIKQLRSGALQIERSEETDQGKYECVASNSQGVRYSAPANLYVRELREVRRVPPRFTILPSSHEIMPGGSVNITCVAVGSPMPYVKWMLNSEDLTPEEEMPVGRNVLELNGVRESANYTCVAMSSLGIIEAVSQVIVKSLPRAPGTPIVTETTATSITITWDSGNPDPVSYYIIQYRAKSPDSKFETVDGITTTRYSIGGLYPNTEYEIRVSAFNTIGQGPPSNKVDARTGEQAPASPPRNVQAQIISPSAVTVRWEEPEEPNGQIKGYRVYYTTDQSQPMSNWKIHNVQDSVITTIQSLAPSETYTIRVLAFTSVGDGPFSDSVHVKVLPGVPGQPGKFRVGKIRDTSIELMWDPPFSKEPIKSYELIYRAAKHSTQEKKVFEPRSSYVVEGLRANTEYTFSLAAISSKGIGAFTNEIFQRTAQARGTLGTAREGPWEPSYPLFSALLLDAAGLRKSKKYPGTHAVKMQESSDAIPKLIGRRYVPRNFSVNLATKTSVLLTWEFPESSSPYRFTVEYNRQKMEVDARLRKAVIPNLMPDTSYDFKITSPEGNLGGLRHRIHAKTSPPMVINRPEIDHNRETETTITIILPSLDTRNNVRNIYVVVVPLKRGRGGNRHLKSPDEMDLEELLKDISQKQHDPRQRQVDLRRAYITARFTPSTLPAFFTLGDQLDYGGFDNRALESGQEYVFFILAELNSTTGKMFVASPYTDPVIAPDSDPQPLDAGDGLIWVVGPVLAVVFIICIVIAILLYKNKPDSKRKDSEPGTKCLLNNAEMMAHHPTDPVEMRRINFQTPGMMSHPPIPIAELAEQTELLKANDNLRLSQEYESIDPGQQFTWEHSNLEVNKPKNRYANVIAYDHTRVILAPVNGIIGSDYINANYIDGYRKQNAYIATQGPLPETFGDFWRMVWEQRAASIVMMTKLEEKSRIKCDQYWPSRGTETYGLVQVTLLDTMELATFCVRTLSLHKSGCNERREVRQFQFTAWPDHGVPEYPTPFLAFLRRVKACNPPDAGPIIVHCSAGVGRTGCFIVIDAMLERIRPERTVDIYGHVTLMRSQRNYMVQTEDQYSFIHEALLEAVTCGNTEVAARSLFSYMQKLEQVESGEHVTGRALEFKRLANTKAHTSRFVTANLPCNKFKNRLVNIMPYETTRVCLQPIRGLDGSDYINASFIDGYRQQKAYIATQGPLAETTEDFWRMLWEHNSTIVVMLTKLREMGREKCHQYWPAERSARYQYFVVDPMAEYNMPQYILREFKVTDARDGQSRTVRQFQFTDWPEQGVPKSGEGFIDFIGQVHKTKEQFGQDGPITVHCSAGVGRTGVFITLSIVLERMRYEGAVDIFQTVKMLRTQRPAMVQTEDEYQFCYQAALEYLGSFDHYAT
ncbi:receptor-type tyrosine-protein phosphatase S isoform X8 [Tachysurus fulvidraco]|nr:receptor-type tyrosine-protein phosphatase S isoform X8 [Tachysurus fulvidraco]XP_047662176.1 receptor-type tyrosine-protein phosphatase S isoform X8 [Tachysurus fulvidraco]XP_047662177.1 receptor-type tyrosine-protein phosphatase S isoform X8 [Tachysurus fulvidraco]